MAYECKSWNGIPVNGLAIGLGGSVNPRSTPDYYNNSNIIMKMQGDVTIFIYFEFFTRQGTHWYYCVTESGVEGYMSAPRLLPITLKYA